MTSDEPPHANSPSSPISKPLPTPTTRPRAGSTSTFDLAPYRDLLIRLEPLPSPSDDEGGDGHGHDAAQRPPVAFDQDVRGAIKVLVEQVDTLMTRLHASLAKQLETEHQLTMARSNLALVEANSEMMEEALRRGGEFSHALVAQTHRRSAHMGMQAPILAASSTKSPRQSTDLSHHAEASPAPRGTSPMTATMPASGSGGGGWFTRRNKTSTAPPAASPAAGSTPISSPPIHALAGSSVMHSQYGSTPNLGLGFGPIGGATTSTSAGGGSGASNSYESPGEIISLRQSLAQERTQRTTLQTRLVALQVSKTALEAELESLSQALFEEANNMVAAERKARLEKEDEAEEAKNERDMLRETVRIVEEDCKALQRTLDSLGVASPLLGGGGGTVSLDSPPLSSSSGMRRSLNPPPASLTLSPPEPSLYDTVPSTSPPTSQSRSRPGFDRHNSSISSSSSYDSAHSGRVPIGGISSPRRIRRIGSAASLARSDVSVSNQRVGSSDNLEEMIKNMEAELGAPMSSTPNFVSSHLSPPSSPQPNPTSPRITPGRLRGAPPGSPGGRKPLVLAQGMDMQNPWS